MDIEMFMPDEKQVDSYQLDKVISILKEGPIYGMEIDMSISTIDHYRKSLKENYENKIAVINDILKTFDTDTLYIPELFEDEIKVLTFLSNAKANSTIKLYKKYLKAKSEYEDSTETKQDLAVDDNQSTDDEYFKKIKAAQLEAFRQSCEIKKLDFKAKELFCDFQEAFAKTESWKELKEQLSKEVKEYQEKIDSIDKVTEEAINLIDNDEDPLEALDTLRGME